MEWALAVHQFLMIFYILILTPLRENGKLILQIGYSLLKSTESIIATNTIFLRNVTKAI